MLTKASKLYNSMFVINKFHTAALRCTTLFSWFLPKLQQIFYISYSLIIHKLLSITVTSHGL